MPKSEVELRADIVAIGRLMFEKGWIASNDGNISIRLDERRILATPAGISKGMLTPEVLIICDMQGNKLEGDRPPTSEMLMHLTIYQSRPDVRAVVHAHPPVATGFAVARRPLNLGALPEVIVALGAVPVAEYGLPGTPALSESMMPFLGNYDALLLANHGVVAYADEVFRAFFRMDTVEHSARITFVAELLGGAKLLPHHEVQRLFESRERYGVQTPNRYRPGWPRCAEDESESNIKPDKIVMSRADLLALIDEALKVRSS